MSNSRSIIKQGNSMGLVKQGSLYFLLVLFLMLQFPVSEFRQQACVWMRFPPGAMGDLCERDCTLGIKEVCFAFLFFILQLLFLK